MSLPPKDFTTTSLHSRGFTLIELLVVISILGIMAAVGLFAYTTVLNKARDTKIRADLDAIGKAYEFRYNFSTNTYEDVLPADFDSGQIPKKPDGTDYPTCSFTTGNCSLPSNDKASFKICMVLNDGSEYCRSSIKGQVTSATTYQGARCDKFQIGRVAQYSGASQVCRVHFIDGVVQNKVWVRCKTPTGADGLDRPIDCGVSSCTDSGNIDYYTTLDKARAGITADVDGGLPKNSPQIWTYSNACGSGTPNITVELF